MVGGTVPYAIGMKDNSLFVFVGLWEGWKDLATDEWLRTCTIMTGESNELIAQIHTPHAGHIAGRRSRKMAGRDRRWRFQGTIEAISGGLGFSLQRMEIIKNYDDSRRCIQSEV